MSFDNNEDVVDINICTLTCDIHLNMKNFLFRLHFCSEALGRLAKRFLIT